MLREMQKRIETDKSFLSLPGSAANLLIIQIVFI